MNQDDRDYYRGRAADERRQAEQAHNPAVRQIHLCIAEEYGRRADPRTRAEAVLQQA